MNKLEFQFSILPSKGVEIVNPLGTVVIVTLWTPIHMVIDRLPKDSPVAAVGQLYGAGLNMIIANLQHNPQIDTLLIFGKELGNGSDHLINYFKGNIVTNENNTVKYRGHDSFIYEFKETYVQGEHSKYVLHPGILPKDFENIPECVCISTKGLRDIDKLHEYLNTYVCKNYTGIRVLEDLLVPLVETSPSNVFDHNICRDTIIEAWEEMLFAVNKFGDTVHLRNDKKRKELLNLKVHIKSPTSKLNDIYLMKYNLSQKDIKEYSKSLLSPKIQEGQTYSYGNRLTEHFYTNSIENAIINLRIPGDKRNTYITLWNNVRDLLVPSGRPCMVSLFLRKIKDTLHMTVTFRTHNAISAWLKNVFGLTSLFEHIADKTNLNVGTLTVISHSISIDPNAIGQVLGYIKEYKETYPRIVMDDKGYFKIYVQGNELVVEHYDNKEHKLITEYRGINPGDIFHKLTLNKVISDFGHALYIGSQIEKAYICMKNNIEYIQDKKILELEKE